MASQKSALSKTLESIISSKIREIESRREPYETRKRSFLDKADAAADEKGRLACLLQAFEELCPSARNDQFCTDISRWLAQSKYDASIPLPKLESFGRQLRTKLDVQSRKLDMAHLYSRLLTEWIHQPSSVDEPAAGASDADSDNESFELVEHERQRLSELVDRFESVVFEPLETAEDEIRTFLDGLFPDEESRKSLHHLRQQIADKTISFMRETSPFNNGSLTNCIKGLLTEHLISDEKQSILRDFLDNDVAKAEIADVLNMRFSDLERWSWNAGPQGIPVVPRADISGKYRVWADDDILQMIFVEYICVRLCEILKPALKSFMEDVCKRDRDEHLSPSDGDKERRKFFTQRTKETQYMGIEAKRKYEYFHTFFLSQLPANETWYTTNCPYDDDDGDVSQGDADQVRRRIASRQPSEPQESPRKKSSIKQQLLRRLSAELIVHRLRGVTHENWEDAEGGVALVQTDVQWYAPGLSHSTIFSVMRYVGFGQEWLEFFKKYLEAPLNLDAASDDRAPKGPRTRKRGVPLAHASEKLIGELVLFFMDVSVKRETGIFLYRLHDDMWVVGEPDRVTRAWKSMQELAHVFGLNFNKKKTGSVYLSGKLEPSTDVSQILPPGDVSVGFLRLDRDSGKWVINQQLVDGHVHQLKKQLGECKSVLSWVQTWNSCIGRFFGSTFGEPAYCFGREHVDEIMETYSSMLQKLFPGADGKAGSLVDHVKDMIRARFGVSVPDSFIFLSEHFGGLGLRSPFVGLFLIQDQIKETPEDLVDDYLTDEREDYLWLKKCWESLREKDLLHMLRAIYDDGEIPKETAIKKTDLQTFYSLEEYSRFREFYCLELRRMYEKLVSVPNVTEIRLSEQVESKLSEFLASDVKLDPQQRWFLQLYADELLEEFGGLNLVDKQFLPVRVLEMIKREKVKWNMVL